VPLLLWIVRLIILLIIIRFIVTLVRGLMSKPAPAPPRPKRSTERLGGTLVQDPQCGTYIPQDRAVAVTIRGATQYFCSAKCRDEWARRVS
jgi:uncharacterized protein